MKRFSAGVLAAAIALAASAAVAQQKPNFSGNWKINQAKSNFGDVPAPDTFTRKIVHAEPSMPSTRNRTRRSACSAPAEDDH